MGAKGRQEDGGAAETLGWLTGAPASDVNFRDALGRANAATLREALMQIEGKPATATKKKALEAALKKLERPVLDPVSEAADQVVEVEQQRADLARKEQDERERMIAQCHEVIGRVQAADMFGKLATVSSLVWLREMKEAKIYRDLPSIGSWDNFCKYLGKDRRTVDEDLQNLGAFGEHFLETCRQLSLGYRDLRKLRQLSHDGAVVIDAEAVVIGDERIPLTPDHKDDLQAALEKLIETKDQLIEEKIATIRANEKVIASKQDLIRRQEKDLARYEKEAAAKGLTPAEDAFIQKCDNARLTIDGFLNQFDPNINPLPADATPRMKATLMHTLAWFKRCIIASFDTANDIYGEAEMDDDWVPPHLRAADVEDVPMPKGCQQCRSAHPPCDQCCKVCPDKCNGAQACYLEA